MGALRAEILIFDSMKGAQNIKVKSRHSRLSAQVHVTDFSHSDEEFWKRFHILIAEPFPCSGEDEMFRILMLDRKS